MGALQSLPFRHQLRIKITLAITRDVQGQIALVGLERFGAGAIACIARIPAC